MRILTFMLFTIAVAITSGNHAIAQDDSSVESIDKMRQRIIQIEDRMKEVDGELAQQLGEEAFGLFGQLDQTYLQLKTSYQQQVIQLNQRMQRKWEQIESARKGDREVIRKQLKKLEKEWDQTFNQLTKIHDDHLSQLKDELAKVRGKFSEVAGKAQEQLEASNFEALSRWERGHEIFLAANKTYVVIVGNQLQWLEGQMQENPDEETEAKLKEVRNRYATLQSRIQKRLVRHVGHLKEELETRQAQLKVTQLWESRRVIYGLIDDLYQRTQSTYEHVQTCMRDSVEAFHAEEANTPTGSSRKKELGANIVATEASLKNSYLERATFSEAECTELEQRIAGSANAEEKATWTAQVTDLKLLAKDLRQKAFDLEPNRPSRTARR